MGVLRYKILYDLWEQKGRTLQVVLIISMGAMAIGMILGTRNLIIPAMENIWRGMNPAMINLFLSPSIDDDELAILRKTEGVVEVEAFNNTTIEWRISPEDEWSQGGLTARLDYTDQRLNKLDLVDGDWPTDDVMLVEDGSDTFFGISPTGEVYLRIDDREHKVQLGGLVYNPASQPAYFGGTAQFYTTLERYDRLVGDRDYNRLLVTAAEYDEDAVTDLADRLQEKLEKQEIDSGRFITDPNKHIFQDQMDGLFFLLGVLGLFALLLGLLLVYNTINAIISQQVDQIGIMKAVGANTWQILRVYLVNILAYSVLSVLFSLPLGILGAWAITSWLVSSFGADPGSFEFSTLAIVVQVIIAVLAPLLASIFPVISGARLTVREAISTYGLSTNTTFIERVLARAKHISRLLLITISNTFRHKWRVILMQVSLVLSGLIFLMVVSVRDSVAYTIGDVIFSILNANITLIFEDPQRISRTEDLLLAHHEVRAVEMWGFAGGNIRPAGQEESEDDEGVTILGVPLPTRAYGYQIRDGRWLDPGDTHAVVLNKDLAEEVGIEVGEWVTIQIDDQTVTDWQIVGLLFDPLLVNSAHVSREVLMREIGSVDKAQTAWIQTHREDMDSEIAIAKDLRVYLKDHQVDVSPQRGLFGVGDSAKESAASIIQRFNFLVVLLGVMAVIIGAVGSIALSGALSLSVLERRREIGVMRAIGASSWTIARLFIGEGLILGWLSWLIAMPLSPIVSPLMVRALGENFEIDLLYNFTPLGPVLWFAIITLLSILASWLPARGATHISVRESLAYQ